MEVDHLCAGQKAIALQQRSNESFANSFEVSPLGRAPWHITKLVPCTHSTCTTVRCPKLLVEVGPFGLSIMPLRLWCYTSALFYLCCSHRSQQIQIHTCTKMPLLFFITSNHKCQAQVCDNDGRETYRSFEIYPSLLHNTTYPALLSLLLLFIADMISSNGICLHDVQYTHPITATC